MDKIDKKILAELQADGRLSVTELAHKVGLSLSLSPQSQSLRRCRYYQRLSRTVRYFPTRLEFLHHCFCDAQKWR